MAVAMEVSADQLREVVKAKHNCEARLASVEFVSEAFLGERVWKGIVHAFDLEGRPTATRAYAGSSPIEGTPKRRFYAVLHVPPVDSPAAAVRAAIVADHRGVS